jgi:hypothetical protein
MTDLTTVPDTTSYRRLSRSDLRPVFISLGLPRQDFVTAGTGGSQRPFDAVLNADAIHPDGLWLFRGSDYYLYDLAQDAVIDGPTQIDRPWGAGNLPELFRSGIHSAVWGGPSYPNTWILFKDEMYYAMDASRGFAQSEGPRGILGSWATGVWAAPNGSWKTPGVPVALHGLGSTYAGMVHFFKDGEYVRHNLNTGGLDVGPVPIADQWKLPAPFIDHIDFAFYGTRAHAEHINFISGDHYILFDFRTQEVIDERSVESRFPVLTQFVNRPQLFLVEEYSLETLVGPVSLGRLIDSRSIGAGSTIKRILVTETTDIRSSSLTESMLQSQNSQVTEDFYQKLDASTALDGGRDNYRYQLDAQLHGDASASSVWGGEVNAKLGVPGQTNTVRDNLSQATFNSISSQQQELQQQTQQKSYDENDPRSTEARVLSEETFEETNTTDHVRDYSFYEQLQAYLTLLVLRQASIGYSDGVTQRRVVPLPSAADLLSDVLVDPVEAKQVLEFLRQELSHVPRYDGQIVSLLDGSSTGPLVSQSQLSTSYTVVRPDGSTQSVPISGLITADRSWVEPTRTITCVQS